MFTLFLKEFKFKNNKFYAIIFSLILFVFGLYSLDHFPTGLFEDDTFFYYTTAYNSLKNGFFTFDGLNSTNGFHPLWMIFLIICGLPLKIIGIKDPSIYGLFFNAISSLIWYLIFINLRNIWTQISALSLSFMTGFGMEGGLAGLIIVEIFKGYFNKSYKEKSWLYLPLILTRIDLSLTAFILAFRKNKFKFYKEFKPYFIILLGICLTFLFNFIIDGHPLSISSFIKSSEITPIFKILKGNLTQNIGNYFRYLFIFSMSCIVFYLVYLKKRRPHLFSNSIPDFTTNLYLFSASLSFLVFHTFFSDTRDWYFTPTGVSLIFLVDKLISQNKVNINIKSLINFFILIITFIELSASLGYFFKEYKSSLLTAEFIKETKNILPNKSKAYVFDSSGFLSWNLLPEVNVINGDGLINSHSYYKMITQKNTELFLNYIRNNDIQYYVTNGNFKHCLGNPYIYKKCEHLKLRDGYSVGKDNFYQSHFEMIGGKELLKSASNRTFLKYKLFKYPDSIFQDN